MSQPLRTTQEILKDELKRLAWHLDQTVVQYGHPDWSVDEMLEGLGDIATQLRTLSAAAGRLVAPEVAATDAKDGARYRWLNARFELLLRIRDEFISGELQNRNLYLKCGEPLDQWIDEQIESERRQPQKDEPK